MKKQLLFLFALMFAGASVWAQSTITVGPSGADYTTIQNAINAATAGDVITVGAGTYNEDLLVNKSVSIHGAGPDQTILTNRVRMAGSFVDVSFEDFRIERSTAPLMTAEYGNPAFDGTTFDNVKFILNGESTNPNTGGRRALTFGFGFPTSVEGNGLTFQNVTMQATDPNEQADFMILESSGGGSVTFDNLSLIGSGSYNGINIYDNTDVITVKNSSTENGGAFYLSGLNDIVVTDNSFSGDGGVFVNGVSSADISGNSFENVSSTGSPAISFSAAWGPLQNYNVSFTNNVFDNVDNKGIRIYSYTVENPDNDFLVANQNDFSGITGLVVDNQYDANTNVDANCNYWPAFTEANIDAKISDGVTYTDILLSDDLTGSCDSPWPQPFRTEDVDEFPVAYFPTLQDAINGAAARSAATLLNASPGIYNETVDINQAGLLVKSANGAAVTTIKGSDAAASEATVRITANNVTLDGFTIDNNGAAAGCVSGGNDAANAKVQNCVMTNSDKGIRGDFYGTFGDNLFVMNNTFDNVARGLSNTENMTNMTVTGNTFDGVSNGISIGTGASFAALITGNTFENGTDRYLSNYEPTLVYDYPTLFANNTFDLAAGLDDLSAATFKEGVYVSIQGAIDAANAGDVIEVAAGTYDGFRIPGLENLTIKSSGTGDVIVIPVTLGGELAGAYIDPGTTGLLIDGLVFDGTDIPGNIRGILGRPGTTYLVENSTFQYLSTGVYANGGASGNVEMTLNNNTFSWCTSAVGGTENTNPAIITNNTFENNRNGIGIANNTMNIDISNNTFNIDDVSAVETYFSGSARYVSNRGELQGLAAEDVIANNTFSPAARFTLSGDNTTHIVPVGSSAIQPVEVIRAGVVVSGHATIQAAVNAAIAGDVIEVAAGTYAEDLNITTKLELRGAQYGVDACNRTLAPALESFVTGNIVVDADGVILDGFYFDFDTQDIRMISKDGVQIRNNKLTKQQRTSGQSVVNVVNSQPANPTDGIIIENNWFFDTGDGPGSDLMAGIGMLGDVDGIKIKNNCFTSMSNGAIYTWNDGWAFAGETNSKNLTNFEISGNYISTMRGNAIQLGLEETISGIISDNEFENWGLGVNPHSTDVPTCGGFGAIHIYPYGTYPQSVEDLTIMNNTFDKGTVCPDGGYGVILRGGTGSAYSNVSIEKNSFTDGNTGVYLVDANVDATEVIVVNNAFIDNDAFGVKSNGTGTLTATCNWWGTTDAVAVGNMVDGDVNYLPFLMNDDLVTPTCGGGGAVNQNTGEFYDNMQDAIDDATPGQTIIVTDPNFIVPVNISEELTIIYDLSTTTPIP